ncbi:MAG TPA: tetratricopeptide repeat protein [Phycisphaerales bacterium]|nr:tetratricopeptide repeat protein [Phycisphaerales bacterium]
MDVTTNNTAEFENTTQRCELLCELGDCYATVGRYPDAKRCYEQAATVGPDEPGPYVGLGVVALQENDLENAELSFRVACRLDGGCAKAYAGLAMIAQQRNDGPRAFDLYLKSLERDADNLTALLGLFQVSCMMGSFAEVIRHLESYLGMHPGDTSVMFCLATLYARDSRLSEARKMLGDIAAVDPENQDAANLLEEVERSLNGRAATT